MTQHNKHQQQQQRRQCRLQQHQRVTMHCEVKRAGAQCEGRYDSYNKCHVKGSRPKSTHIISSCQARADSLSLSLSPSLSLSLYLPLPLYSASTSCQSARLFQTTLPDPRRCHSTLNWQTWPTVIFTCVAISLSLPFSLLLTHCVWAWLEQNFSISRKML